MKFPCPECERPLAPDLDWQYCPYCGSLLHHSSRVAEWKEAATYPSFGAATFASDELIRRGIPTRVRAEIASIDTMSGGGLPYHAVDVSADTHAEAIEALAEFHASAEDDEIEPDAAPNAIAEKGASFLMTLIVLGFVGVILIAILGAVVSWADKEFFGG